MEAKIALIELLKRYTFVRAPDTEVTVNPFSSRYDIVLLITIVVVRCPLHYT